MNVWLFYTINQFENETAKKPSTKEEEEKHFNETGQKIKTNWNGKALILIETWNGRN